MPAGATRKLLMLFGVALTEFDDHTSITLERLEAREPKGISPLPRWSLSISGSE